MNIYQKLIYSKGRLNLTFQVRMNILLYFVLDDFYSVILGDLNDDNIVNIQDIIIIINFVIFDWEPNESQILAGDLNIDGTIDILDIVLTVNIILGR